MSNRVEDVSYEPRGAEGVAENARHAPAPHAESGARRPVGKAEQMIALINDRKRNNDPRR